MASCSAVCGSEPSERAQSVVDSGCHTFGVRSYLHHFYEECTASMWDQQEDFQTQRSPQWWSSGLWKVSLAFGAVVLLVGLVVLTVGYAIPTRIEAFGEGELLFVDRQAMRFNQGLHLSVMAGTGMLSLGGLLMAGGLLMSAFCRTHNKEEENQVKPSQRDKKGGQGGSAGAKSSPGAVTKSPVPVSSESKVPITLSKVENIQPSS
ncbi:neurensin 1-like [Chanos chanos]|uniref:Neurensin 1-like n=1 Tax=Chanos chanos TaxID=29144 RepID=A0A6J2WM33_CHACN|nr:neurensin-1-like [Chanos chanos]